MKFKLIKNPEEIERLKSEASKIKIKPVKPIEINIKDEKYNDFIKALPYYILRSGEYLEKLSSYVPNKKVSLVIKIAGKTLKFLSRYYKIS